MVSCEQSVNSSGRVDGQIKDGIELIGKRRPSAEGREAIECDQVLVG